MEYELTVCERPYRLVLEGRGDGFYAVDEITLAPREHGTRVTYEARIELEGLRRLADPALAVLLQGIGRLAARGLRERMTDAKGATKGVDAERAVA